MKKHKLIAGLLAAAALFALAPAQGLLACEDIPFSEARILFEYNSTDQDAGIQVFLDGDAWKEVTVTGPDGQKIFQVKGKGNLKTLGLTEEFFESEEPAIGEEIDSLQDFLNIFPAGEYQFEGKTVEEDRLVGSATLSHVIPCGPEVVSPAEEAVVDPTAAFVVIQWDPVTGTVNPVTLACENDNAEITGYQVIVEQEEPTLRVFSVDLPASATSVTVPPEFLLADLDPEEPTEFKYEVVATEASGNRTIVERFFFVSVPAP